MQVSKQYSDENQFTHSSFPGSQLLVPVDERPQRLHATKSSLNTFTNLAHTRIESRHALVIPGVSNGQHTYWLHPYAGSPYTTLPSNAQSTSSASTSRIHSCLTLLSRADGLLQGQTS
ncbi:unnamed protein product [Phytophthora lilii]|uniref:Unnamed protein product n=1 Tax=Phytophthora lilii TaxID=2077276 RepID=A0A9W7CSF9_9STRA|nr:unnamed protein product [Phytophthora lilii]